MAVCARCQRKFLLPIPIMVMLLALRDTCSVILTSLVAMKRLMRHTLHGSTEDGAERKKIGQKGTANGARLHLRQWAFIQSRWRGRRANWHEGNLRHKAVPCV